MQRTNHAALLRYLPALEIFLLAALLATPGLAQSASQGSSRASSAAGSGLYTIAGTVVNAASGEPLRHASVAVLSEEDSHTIAAVESDGDGHFSLDRLPAAKYQLTASKRGFRTAFYDEHQEFNSAIVTGPGQETTQLTFRLVPGAVLHGVVSTDGGDPVENARVMLFLKSRDGKAGGRIARSDTTTTDDTGAYEFSNLAAGEYLLAVVAEPWYALHRSARRAQDAGSTDQDPAANPAAALDVAYPVTFFDSTTDEASASRIVLAGGNRQEADINLHAVPALRIDVDTPRKQDGSIARAELRQTVFGTVIGAESAGFLDAMQTGTTEFNGVAPGHYELAQGDPPRTVEMDATASLQVDPASGTPTTPVRGSLRTPAGVTLGEDCSLTLEPVDGNEQQSPIQSVCVHGVFTFSSVPAGQWQLSAESGGTQLSIGSITSGGHTRLGNLITVQDRPLSVVVAVTQGATRVEGFARRDGKGVAGVMVVLVPREMAALEALARRDQSDSDGSFALRDVVPGQYTLVAIEDGWALDWAEPEVMARYLRGGIAVTVTDKAGKVLTLADPVPVQSR
ncbi:MAG TPA: carboxypeptidase-like regulatory domain-containing protein [Terracidiphilus sp.]|jgi:hypothetical protein